MRIIVMLLSFVAITAGCSDSNEVTEEDLAAYEVKQTFEETREDDFILRLESEKAEYMQGEKVKLYGEIIYTGESPLTIAHASSAIYFTLKEQVRGYEITSAVQEIGMQTELVPHKPYRETYLKLGVFPSEFDDKDVQAFIEDFVDRNDFPPGYYVVEATTGFFDGTEHREIKAEIDFKVVTEMSGD